MISKIIDGISIAINKEFGDEYEIYTENIEQGLKEPCFSVVCRNTDTKHFLNKKYFSKNQFCIYYFPKDKAKNNECMSVIERLFDCLETIMVDGDLIRGTGMNAEIKDGIVSFEINYNIFLYKEYGAIPIMDGVSHNTKVKG